MKMVLLHMKIMRRIQLKFPYQNHINGVIIVESYVAKYVNGLKEQYFFNVHILMGIGAVLNVEDVLEKPIGV